MINITPVNEKKSEEIKNFINFPFMLYKDSPVWVPELKADTKSMLFKDPFWTHADRQIFLAYKDGVLAGRIMALVNRTHNEYRKEKTGMFGFFDSINDAEVSLALINAAKAWLKEKGMNKITGPFNPSTNHTCGMLTDNFDKMPYIMMPYNYDYYPALMEAAGLSKAKDLLAFERTKETVNTERGQKIIDRMWKRTTASFRPVNLKKLSSEIETVRKIYNAAWAENWGFLPISEDEIQRTAQQIVHILVPENTVIAEIGGVPVGFCLPIPNMNHVLKKLKGSLANPFNLIKALSAWKKITDCRMIMLGVLPEYRGRGIEMLLIDHMIQNGLKYGWVKAELSWILEDNKDVITVITEFGCVQTRRYRIYGADI